MPTSRATKHEKQPMDCPVRLPGSFLAVKSEERSRKSLVSVSAVRARPDKITRLVQFQLLALCVPNRGKILRHT
eukprot:2706939-Pleurochrysis_carterae.AAC.10